MKKQLNKSEPGTSRHKPGAFKTANVMKEKKRAEQGSRLKKTQETWQPHWLLNLKKKIEINVYTDTHTHTPRNEHLDNWEV